MRSIETAVPPTVLAQEATRDLFLAQPGRSRRARRLIGAVFDASAIATRHTVLSELGRAEDATTFREAKSGMLLSPGTGTRNDVYREQVPALVSDAARRALASSGFTAGDVTHVVTVSCTGFFAPGPDFVLVRELGLRPETQRYHLGFQGCCAAFPALRAARQFCLAEPDAVVVVVCVELCTLHVHASDDPDTIVASALFADGVAAAVVSGRPDGGTGRRLDLDVFATTVTPTGEADMAWTIGDHGFDMVLSSYVPTIIGRSIADALGPVLSTVAGAVEAPATTIQRWAVHPGGRAILDRVQQTLELDDAQLADSRTVLRDFGNMSSATVLFVLRRLLHDDESAPPDDATPSPPDGATPADGERVCAMAFGPGLTVESALLTLRAPA